MEADLRDGESMRRVVERGPDGKPIVWAVEMAGSAASAQGGISVSSFPAGTIFTVSLHPLRSGEPAGAREGALFKCPVRENADGVSKSVPPPAGMHCDSVDGRIQIGGDDGVPRATQSQNRN
jgi:hypothetical protein